MNKNKIDNLMDKYATGTLSQAEIKEIEELINSDPSFQKEFDMRKDISDGVNIAGNRDLRKMLNKLHDDIVVKKPSSKGKGRVIKLLMSAAAMLLGGLVFFQLGFLNFLSSSNTEKSIQYASYYKPDISNSRSTDGTRENYLLPFASAYQEGKFEKVISIVEPYLEESNNEIKLLTSIAALETGDVTKAMDLLNKILATGNYYYRDHANWYKALAYLQLEDIDNAKVLLGQLANDSKADHHKEAKELLNKI